MKKQLANLLSFLGFFGILFFSSCSAESDGGINFVDANPNDIEIEVRNQTSYVLDDIRLDAFSKVGFYGGLSVGRTSQFINYPYAYTYVGLSFKVNEIEFEYQPANFETEELTFGQYELAIRTLDTNNRTFTFRLTPLD